VPPLATETQLYTTAQFGLSLDLEEATARPVEDVVEAETAAAKRDGREEDSRVASFKAHVEGVHTYIYT
jgi:hypothetical protein